MDKDGVLFLGDIAVGTSVPLAEYPKEIRGKISVGNLEGAIIETSTKLQRQPIVYNDPEVLKFLEYWNCRVVSLANNHFFDTANALDSMKILDDWNIRYCGAGSNFAEAIEPVNLPDFDIGLLSFGWEPIGCSPARRFSPGVNPLTPENFRRQIQTNVQNHPYKNWVVLVHWNYEMEAYPQPLHRELAHTAVDCGAKAVIGHHPHCVQGIEFYRDCPIVYSLGNGLFTQNVFFRGRLKFPAFCSRQLVFEWCPQSRRTKCHWLEYSPNNHSLKLIQSENARTSSYVKKLTPFAGMDAANYLLWFKQHRRKKKLLPVYQSQQYRFVNDFYDHWVKIRAFLIRWTFILKTQKRCNQLI